MVCLNRWMPSQSLISKASQLLLILLLSSVCWECFAAGQDILKGAEVDLSATLKGTGRTLLYITEIVTAVTTYIKSRNMMALVGVIILVLAFEFFLKLIGI